MLEPVNGFCSRFGVTRHPFVLSMSYSNIFHFIFQGVSNISNITFQPLATLLAENASFPMRGRERCCKGLGARAMWPSHGNRLSQSCHNHVTFIYGPCIFTDTAKISKATHIIPTQHLKLLSSSLSLPPSVYPSIYPSIYPST